MKIRLPLISILPSSRGKKKLELFKKKLSVSRKDPPWNACAKKIFLCQ